MNVIMGGDVTDSVKFDRGAIRQFKTAVTRNIVEARIIAASLKRNPVAAGQQNSACA